ncbi:MAG: DUF1501 domain-containing protein [Phycisphaerales bacterium]|nr:DUF1501 domain-containing protein [Phycisphaerales bacterium]
MSDHSTKFCCDEYAELSRRRFLQVTGAGATAAAVLSTAPAWLPRVAYAGTPPTSARDVVVSIYLRGGVDGLSVCVPFNDPVYAAPATRPNLRVYAPDDTTQPVGRRAIAIANASATSGSNTFNFGLHPALSPLLPAYQAGKFLIVQATGLTSTNKSHFDAQRWMENGQANSNNVFTGWLGRHLASTPPINPQTALRAIGVADGLQRTLAGAPLALPVPNLQSNPGNPPLLNNLAAVTSSNSGGYGVAGTSASSTARRAFIGNAHAGVPDPLGAAAANTLNTIVRLNQIGATGYQPAGGAVYPTSSLGYALRSTAALINANDDASVNQFVEAVAIDVGNWDTHSAQFSFNVASGVFTGQLVTNLNGLAQSLAAFFTDVIATRNKRVTVVVVSEFGRRVGENGTVGTDHGYGNMSMVLGSHVLGGRVLTTWPGLPSGVPATNQDLQVTTDLRHILAEIVSKRLNNSANLPSIFPGFTPNFLNICT